MHRMTIAVACLVALAGCEARNAPGELRPEADPYLNEGRVQFENKWTRDHVKVVSEPDAQRLPSGLLKVTLEMRNLTKENLWCDIRTTFLDDRKHVLEQTSWEPIMLDRSTVSTYTCASLSNQAADYQIIIKRAAKTKLKRP